MLIQSVLFFILGIAATALVLILLAPPLWRRALYLARRDIAGELPLTLTEIEADRDFLRARQAIEIVKRDEKYNSLFESFTRQKLAFDTAKEQLQRLSDVENRLHATEEKLADTTNELKNEKHVAATLHRFKGRTLKEIRDIVRAERQAQIADTKRENELKKREIEVTKHEEELANSRQEIATLNEKLTACERKAESDNRVTVEIGKLREQIVDIAATFTAKVAHDEGQASPLINLVQNAHGDRSLAARIKNDVDQKHERNKARRSKKTSRKSRHRRRKK